VVWRLKRGVTWHDGRPFTADDVIFTWQYAADPSTAATSAGSYQGIDHVDRLDDHTVKVVFKRPTPYWADAFCSAAGMVLPRHVFESFRGDKSREAAANLRPVGTGPYRFVDFKPGDVLHAEINGVYHVPNRPFFDTVELKGGGDPVSAGRAVLQTGEYDYAWGVQMEHEILQRLEQSAKGHFVIGRTANVEYIQLNQTDPWREVDGERASVKTTHPFLTDPAVRTAVLNALRGMEGIAQAYTADEILAPGSRTSSDPGKRAAAFNFYRGRSGDIIIVPRENWILSTSATTQDVVAPTAQRTMRKTTRAAASVTPIAAATTRTARRRASSTPASRR